MNDPAPVARRAAASGLLLGLLAAAAGAQAIADNLGDFRALAAALRKQGPGSDTGLVLEYRVSRHSNACDGDRPETWTRLHGDGRVTRVVIRSPGETRAHGPARFEGRVDRAAWDSAFSALAAMRWAPMGPLPMPGMSEAFQEIQLRHRGEEGEFGHTGRVPPGQDRIDAGLDAVGRLAQAALRDTVWALDLAAAAKPGKGALTVAAAWTLRGRAPLRIRMPLSAPPPACGSLELAWHVPPKEEKGVTPLPPEIHLASPKGTPPTPGAWRTLRPGDTLRAEVAFPRPAGKPPRSGRLVHLGLSAVEEGRADSLALTLFSDDFPF